MLYDAIIFDIDGTLWNACAVSAKGMNEALHKLGISRILTAEEVESVCGKPSNQVLSILFGKLLDQHPEMLTHIDEGERKAIESEGGTMFEGVLEGIRDLSRSSKIFLVSNCQDWYLEAFIKFSGLSGYITYADCYGLSGIEKADMIRNILETHHTKHAVYIGDTLGDQKAAELAGTDFIGAAYGFGDVTSAYKSFRSFVEITDDLMRS